MQRVRKQSEQAETEVTLTGISIANSKRKIPLPEFIIKAVKPLFEPIRKGCWFATGKRYKLRKSDWQISAKKRSLLPLTSCAASHFRKPLCENWWGFSRFEPYSWAVECHEGCEDVLQGGNGENGCVGEAEVLLMYRKAFGKTMLQFFICDAFINSNSKSISWRNLTWFIKSFMWWQKRDVITRAIWK